MNRLKKEMRKNPKCAEYFDRQTEYHRAVNLLRKELIRIFKIEEILNWLNKKLSQYSFFRS